MATCYAKDVFWWQTEDVLPEPGKIVLVKGGVATCSYEGVWYTETGEDFGRPIAWPVKYWAELPEPPIA